MVGVWGKRCLEAKPKHVGVDAQQMKWWRQSNIINFGERGDGVVLLIYYQSEWVNNIGSCHSKSWLPWASFLHFSFTDNACLLRLLIAPSVDGWSVKIWAGEMQDPAAFSIWIRKQPVFLLKRMHSAIIAIFWEARYNLKAGKQEFGGRPSMRQRRNSQCPH